MLLNRRRSGRAAPPASTNGRFRSRRSGQRGPSVGEEWKEGGQKLCGLFEVWDVPALGHHNSLGVRNVFRCLLRKGQEVAESSELLRTCVLAQWNNVIPGANDEQCGGLDEVVFVSHWLLVDHLKGQGCRSRPLLIVGAECHPHQDV
jgi:hypothetical protein